MGPRGVLRLPAFFACHALYCFLVLFACPALYKNVHRKNYIPGRSRARSTHPRGGRWDLGGVSGPLRPAPKTLFEKKKNFSGDLPDPLRARLALPGQGWRPPWSASARPTFFQTLITSSVLKIELQSLVGRVPVDVPRPVVGHSYACPRPWGGGVVLVTFREVDRELLRSY